MSERVLTTVELAALGQPIVDFLADNGIAARLRTDDAGGVDPALAFANGTDILVAEGEWARARALLEEFNAAPVEIPPQD